MSSGPRQLAGDGQADLKHHGGLDKALCLYPHVHFAYWARRLGHALPMGAFGENMTLSGVDEATVCIGDILSIGDVRIEISQPRSPCWKVARRWKLRKLAYWIQQTGYSGWYARVLKTGSVRVGMHIGLQCRPFPQWTVARITRMRYGKRFSRREAAKIAEHPVLNERWREAIANRLKGNAAPPPDAAASARLDGVDCVDDALSG